MNDAYPAGLVEFALRLLLLLVPLLCVLGVFLAGLLARRWVRRENASHHQDQDPP